MNTNNREPAYDGGPFNFVIVAICGLAGAIMAWVDVLTRRRTK